MNKTRYLDIHTHKVSGEDLIEIVNVDIDLMSDPLYLSMGVHPYNIGKVDIDALLSIMRSRSLSAVGEVGIDRSIKIDIETQLALFRVMIEFANRERLPLIIHSVRAYDILLMVADEIEVPAIVHGFSGGVATMEQLISKGYYLSFGEKGFSSKRGLEALKQIPLENLFFESDCDDISVVDLYKRCAIIRDIDETVLKKIIFATFIKIFR